MLIRAAGRLFAAAQRGVVADISRVGFEQCDIHAKTFPAARYDAVATFFFFDCFTSEQVDAIVARVLPGLTPDARWLFADFTMPPGAIAQWRARAWLAALYGFFRWQTRLDARRLPPSDEILRGHGLQCIGEKRFDRGFVRSAHYRLCR